MTTKALRPAGGQLSHTKSRDKWEMDRDAERIRYAVPPKAHWLSEDTYQGAELNHRSRTTRPRYVGLTGKPDNT